MEPDDLSVDLTVGLTDDELELTPEGLFIGNLDRIRDQLRDAVDALDAGGGSTETGEVFVVIALQALEGAARAERGFIIDGRAVESA